MCVPIIIIYFLLVKLIKFFSSIILYIASSQLWWIKIFKFDLNVCPAHHVQLLCSRTLGITLRGRSAVR